MSFSVGNDRHVRTSAARALGVGPGWPGKLGCNLLKDPNNRADQDGVVYTDSFHDPVCSVCLPNSTTLVASP